MSRSNKASWQNRLQYKFDNFMSRGGLSVFLALLSAFFAAFLLLAICRYFAELFYPNEYIEDSSDLSWEIFVQLIGLRDTGDEANFAAKLVGVITIFVGLVLFSSLVAFITEEFESRLQLLRKGKSMVVEENHTLILGFNDRIGDIIRELVFANESEPDAVVVILSEADKEDMDDFIRNQLGNLKTTRVVTRNGAVANLQNLQKVGVKVAKSAIVLNDAKGSDTEEFKALSDARVVKAILAVVAANEEGSSLPAIVVELHSGQYRILAENIAPGAVTTLNEADILARILVQTSRNVGLAAVYLNLVGFEGNEFYFYRPDSGWPNLTFGELIFHFLRSRPLGVRHADGTLILRPSKDYQLASDDEIIILAEDDSTIKFYPEILARPRNLGYAERRQSVARHTEKHLVIGWNPKAPIALREYAQYALGGSQINLAVNDLTPEIQGEFDRIAKSYPDVRMEAMEVNVDSVEELWNLKPYEFNSIPILAGSGENPEEIDAKTLTVLLQLRQVFREYSRKTGQQITTELIAEIVNSEDTDLVIKAGVKDFLLSNQIVSKILAQASQEPDVMLIYNNLFDINGCELYIKPVSLYFPPKLLGQLTFADCVEAALARDEICIGIKFYASAEDKNKNFGIDLIPSLHQQLNLTLYDALITLAEDET